MSKAKAKFAVGDAVNHPAAPDGSYPAGTGTVESVTPAGDSYSYKIRCDATKKVLPTAFKESDLSAC